MGMYANMVGGGGGGAGMGGAPAGGGGMGGGIGGALPWGSGGAGALGQNPAAAYASAYNDALNMNKANYQNILAGYNGTMQQQQSRQQGISAGYGQLTGDVMGLIAGTDSAQRQAIADQYQANRGQASQSLIDRGLGNTTVQSAVDRGLQYDRSKSEVNLSNQFAQLNAQYRTQLGLAGLDYQNQANMQNTGLANQQLQWMNSVNAGYPNAAAYSQLAMQRGAVKAGALPMSGAMGGGGVSWDKKPTPAGSPAAPSYFGGSSGYGGGAWRPPNYNFGNSESAIYPGGGQSDDPFSSGYESQYNWGSDQGGGLDQTSGDGWAGTGGSWGDGAPTGGSEYSYY